MLNIALPPDVESMLRAQANEQGIGADEYASKLIAEYLPKRESGDDGDEDSCLRGTVPLELDRQGLFTQSAKLSPQDLPKWKPSVTLTRRDLAPSDDE
jgi:hypothetical protein